MTSIEMIKYLQEKEEISRQEGIKSIIVDFYVFLYKLNIRPMLNKHIDGNLWNSYDFMHKYSPIYKKKV